MRYWLFKSESSVFNIEDLMHRPGQTASWDGVRNYQVRNMLRDEIKKGDLAFFYYSSCTSPGIVGIMEVVKEGYPDHTAYDPTSPYCDPKSNVTQPRWMMVDVKFIKKFSRIITLTELKARPALKNILVLRKGNRLSITPVTPSEWKEIMSLAHAG